MPTANVIYYSPRGCTAPSSPLAGDPWDVTTCADPGAVAAALERHPDALLVDAPAAPDLSDFRAECARRKTPVLLLDSSDGVKDLALAFENARIDRQLDQLRDLGGGEFVTEMIDLMIAQTPGQLRAMRAALGAGDVAGVQKVAHSLKSSAGNFGGRVLQELCVRTERAATDGNVAELGNLLDQADEAFGRLKIYLESKRT